MLAEENREAEEAIKEARDSWYEKEMEQRKLLPKGERPGGRPANPYKITKKTRRKTRKGGIDWFRYRESICEDRLYPFYHTLLASPQHGERGPIQLIEDGAGPHRSKFLNQHHEISGIQKISWPPCKSYYLYFNLIILHINLNSVTRFESNRTGLGLYSATISEKKAFSYN